MKKNKPKYGILNTVCFTISLAMKNVKSVVYFCLLLIFVGFITNITELFFIPTIISKIENSVKISNLFLTISFFTIALITLNAIKGYTSNYILFGRIESRFVWISMLNEKFAKTSYPNIEDENFTKQYNRSVNNTMNNASAPEAIWSVLTDLSIAILAFIFYVTLLSNLNIFIALLIAITSILSFFITKNINEWGYRHRDEGDKLYNSISYINNKSEDVDFAKDIRIFGMKSWINDIYSSTLSLTDSFIKKREFHYIKADFIDLLLTFLRNGLAYFFIISITLENKLSTAEFLLYFTAVSSFSAMLLQLLSKFSELHKHCIDLSAIREFIEFKEIFNFENSKTLSFNDTEEYTITLKNVSFKYPQAKENTLSNINLTLSSGEKLAIVGLNGAGKTTLVKLICGFYDPTEGEVLLNGINIKAYNRDSYYKYFSTVFQTFSVLDVTIAENISQTYGDFNIELVNDCIEKAGLSSKIASLKNGIYTHVGKAVFDDGIELSGGEIQRLMLARALYKNAPFVILDEPTAALDPIAESDIYNKYNDMTKNKTSLFISHRLASTSFCDRIILIQNGIIAEEGTHQSLLDLGKTYCNLFQVQSKYYSDEVIENE